MFELLRYYTFWTLDFFKGSHFKKHYKDIKFINENFSLQASKSKRSKHLRQILEHAITTTSYYKSYSVDLQEFPVVTKAVIRDRFNEFESTKFIDKKKHKVSTSGSTGTPFTTYLDMNKRMRNSVDTIYFSKMAGFKLGNELFYIRLWDQQHQKNKLSFWLQNIKGHDVSKLSDVDIESLLKKVTSNKNRKGLLAYASAYDTICHYLDKKKSKSMCCNVTSIIAISECLTPYARESMKKYFCCDVVSRYSASEMGIIAQQQKGNGNFDINWASYYVEILKINKDSPVDYGELGRIVITDLFNYAVPMIRYDIGDLGIIDIDKQTKIPVLVRIEGRRMDMLYTTAGVLISSHIVHQICLFKGVKEYQLIQEGEKQYIFRVCVTPEFTEEKKLVSDYKKYFGNDALIKVEYVNSIPLLSSGKRKKVINNYYKPKA